MLFFKNLCGTIAVIAALFLFGWVAKCFIEWEIVDSPPAFVFRIFFVVAIIVASIITFIETVDETDGEEEAAETEGDALAIPK